MRSRKSVNHLSSARHTRAGIADSETDSIARAVTTGRFTPRQWLGLPLEASSSNHPIVLDEAVMPESMLWILDEGRTPVRWRESGRRKEQMLVQDTAVFWAKGHRLTDIRTPYAHKALAVFFPEDRIEAWLHDDARLLARNLSAVGPHAFRIDPFAVQSLRAIASEIEQQCPSGAVFAEAVSIALMTHLAGTWTPGQDRHRRPIRIEPAFVRKLRAYIDDNLAADLSLLELGTVVALSPRHLSRGFKSAMGVSVHQYILQRRIERAKILLRLLPVTEVAFATGFASPSHFSSAFRNATGIAPLHYKDLS